MDFDEDRIYYSHQNLAAGPNANNNGADGQQQRPPGHAEAMLDLEDGAVDLGAVRRHFREFLREFGVAGVGYILDWAGGVCKGEGRTKKAKAAQDVAGQK